MEFRPISNKTCQITPAESLNFMPITENNLVFIFFLLRRVAWHLLGQHGILIFSCLLFVLFEKRNPDIFVWFLSLCYTMVVLGIYCPKILCIKKIAEIKTHYKYSTNFLLNCESGQIFAFILHKTNEKIWRITALESIKWSNQKDNGTLLCQVAPN